MQCPALLYAFCIERDAINRRKDINPESRSKAEEWEKWKV